MIKKKSNNKSSITNNKTKPTAVKKTDKKAKTNKDTNKTNKKEIANIKDGKDVAEKTKEIENNIESSIKHKTRKK